MSRPSAALIAVVALFALVAAPWPALTQEDAPSASQGAPGGDDDAPKPKTHEVKAGPFRVTVSATGVFESGQMTEVSLEPEAWSSFKVLQAVPHGTPVVEGDVLVTFDPEKLEQEIEDLEAGQRLAHLGMELAEKDLEYSKQFQPLDLVDAQRNKRIADEDLAWFTETDRALSERSAEESLKGAGYRLEYAQEELDQLQQMYEADDLTEETEELILKRQQRSVESARFWLERATASTEQTLETELPRKAERLEAAARRQALNLSKTTETGPIQLVRKELELEKQAYARKKSDERLAKLQADRELLVVKAPASGVVYYGQATRGKWGATDNIAKQLRRGGNVAPHQVFMTIVAPRPISVRVPLAEKDLRYLGEGVAAKVVPTAYPDRKLSGSLSKVAPIPFAAGMFDAAVAVEVGDDAAAIMPGMACDVKIVAYDKADALTVPSSAIFHDEPDDDAPYVYLVDGEGSHEKRPVALGKHGEKEVEVVDGLQAGDEILVEKPKD